MGTRCYIFPSIQKEPEAEKASLAKNENGTKA